MSAGLGDSEWRFGHVPVEPRVRVPHVCWDALARYEITCLGSGKFRHTNGHLRSALCSGTRAERADVSTVTAAQAQVQCDGAGGGNRTLVFSLEGCCSTIELHPRLERSTNTPCRRPQPPRNRSETIGKPPGTRQSWPGHLANRPDSGRNQRRSAPLTPTESLPILMSPQTTKGGDPVSLTKRCHLAGIAR